MKPTLDQLSLDDMDGLTLDWLDDYDLSSLLDVPQVIDMTLEVDGSVERTLKISSDEELHMEVLHDE